MSTDAEVEQLLRGDDPAPVEEAGWRALATDAEAATAFYGRVLDERVVMLLPGGLVLEDRDAALAAMGGQPWSRYRLERVEALRASADTAMVHYGVQAEREGAAPYSALVGSLYVRRPDGWRLAFHQQTPR